MTPAAFAAGLHTGVLNPSPPLPLLLVSPPPNSRPSCSESSGSGLSSPSAPRTSLDRLSTPGSGPSIPFRAARPPFGFRCRHFNSAARVVCRRSRGMDSFPDTSHERRVTLSRLSGTFRDNHTNPRSFGQPSAEWDGGSYLQLLRGFPLPHGYPRASSPGRRRMNVATPVSRSSTSRSESRRPCQGSRGFESGRHHGL